MKNLIIQKLQILQERYKKIKILLSDSCVISDKNRFRDLLKEYTKLTDIMTCYKTWNQIQKDIQIVKKTLLYSKSDYATQDKLKQYLIHEKKIIQQLQTFFLPENSNDKNGCFLEIRAGTGGYEAANFAGDLFRMYNRFTESKRWKMEIINISNSEHGGYKEIIIKIPNSGAYGQFKFESGGHRVQRIPETESQGRIHTSTCKVAVMSEVQEKESIVIHTNELRIDTFRSSGAGGQHVNTTDSAIRITHLPTGLVVECQAERSQHKNKTKAMSVLQARLKSLKEKQRQNKESSTRRNLLGSGDRSDRIRTYNFPKKRITDHRINLTLYNLDDIIEGKLDMIIQPIIQEYYIDQLKLLTIEKS